MVGPGESEIQPAPLQSETRAPLASSQDVRDALEERRQLRKDRAGGSDALFAAAALLPALLASSCCIPQLLLTLCFGFGCVGFAALTPFRPFFLALTAIAVVAAIQGRGWRTRTVLLVLLTCSVAFSDVVVREYNDGDMQKAVARTKLWGHRLPSWMPAAFAPPQWVPSTQLLTKPPSRAHPSSPPAATREQIVGSTPVSAAGPRQATVILTALNISCEACAARIKTGLKKKFGKHIISVEVQQKSKAVIVQLLDQAAVNDQALLEALAQLKSPGNLVRRDLAPE
mmetsp:Transcript_1717/g.4993  ORF Transcript_1717/g.4993 Transcript_1717/m.4993 type:complete len:285 (+) Transcript_1717:256-1110(+)|eukprot:CAMPEP_0206141962 /NCGR_PEP_ID=MMETSP1473-20131121/14910_1 /ASSEMBLY_ACC=CAM_ASM_001109 /TAXON_ID=1461547 /ORGANISM="Stichococcus sp, Strain RCC1054" /LENGTH=284 /DNA_ID=CAMNT_0053536735 /DNA_START=227 /DNA_END=1081 /DNA_ORIENTATION=-